MKHDECGNYGPMSHCTGYCRRLRQVVFLNRPTCDAPAKRDRPPYRPTPYKPKKMREPYRTDQIIPTNLEVRH